MYKSTASAEQFQDRSGSESTKGSRKGFGLLGGGDCPTSVLDDDQKRHNLKAGLTAQLRQMQVRMAQLKADVKREAQFKKRAFHVAIAERNELGIEMQRVLSEIAAIKVRPNSERVERHFIDICKETMPSGQFKALMRQALRRSGAL